MASIAAAIERIKNNPLSILDAELIRRICEEHKYVWRDRVLDPAATIALFMQQILHGNVPCAEVRHLAASTPWASAGGDFSAQAYCQARARLPLAVFQSLVFELHQRVIKRCGESSRLWHGHRTFHIDGSGFSMPDTPELRKVFGTASGQAPGCGFPVAHLLVLFNAATGMLIDMWASHQRTGDVAESLEAHLHLDAGDILIGDDSYSGYPHLASLAQQGLHGLFPVHHRRVVDFKKNRPHCGNGKQAVAGMPRSRWIKSLGKEDQLVEYFKDGNKPAWMSQQAFDALPKSITVRELRRTVVRPGLGKLALTLVTTLTDAEKYPAEQLLELRLRRWDVETNIGHLKTTMKMDVLHCKTEKGIRKELAVFGLIYNLVRLVMLEAAHRQDVPVSRISFADAYKWMRHAGPKDVLPALIVNPLRPHRIEPRCKKRRPKQFDLMNKPRRVLRQLLKNKRKTA